MVCISTSMILIKLRCFTYNFIRLPEQLKQAAEAFRKTADPHIDAYRMNKGRDTFQTAVYYPVTPYISYQYGDYGQVEHKSHGQCAQQKEPHGGHPVASLNHLTEVVAELSHLSRWILTACACPLLYLSVILQGAALSHCPASPAR